LKTVITELYKTFLLAEALNASVLTGPIEALIVIDFKILTDLLQIHVSLHHS